MNVAGPVLGVGDGALQRTCQVNVKQRSVETVHNRDLLVLRLVRRALLDGLFNAVLATAAAVVLAWTLRP